MIYKILLIVNCCIFVFGSCYHSIKDREYLNVFCDKQQSFSIDSTTKKMNFATIENDKYLGFDTLNAQSDTFRLRVEYYKKYQVLFFEFAICNSFISFKKYTFAISQDREGRILFDRQRENNENYSVKFDPQKKGKDFIQVLKENKILEIPDCSDIRGYPIDEESKEVFIEYSNKCRYKIIHYNNPHLYSDKFEEANNVANFMNYLKKEFEY